MSSPRIDEDEYLAGPSSPPIVAQSPDRTTRQKYYDMVTSPKSPSNMSAQFDYDLMAQNKYRKADAATDQIMHDTEILVAPTEESKASQLGNTVPTQSTGNRYQKDFSRELLSPLEAKYMPSAALDPENAHGHQHLEGPYKRHENEQSTEESPSRTSNPSMHVNYSSEKKEPTNTERADTMDSPHMPPFSANYLTNPTDLLEGVHRSAHGRSKSENLDRTKLPTIKKEDMSSPKTRSKSLHITIPESPEKIEFETTGQTFSSSEQTMNAIRHKRQISRSRSRSPAHTLSVSEVDLPPSSA